jgi:radical SAM superfamily enzyme YgiQ (UPF0313 family)
MNLTSIRRVHFIEFNASISTLQQCEVFPKYGTPLLAAILKEQGYDARIFLEGVSDMSFDKLANCDAVCFPVFAPALTKVRACARRLREARPDVPIIMGGPHVCLFPETVVDVCDCAVRCEGDEILPEVLQYLSQGRDWRLLNGLSFMENGRIIHNPDALPPRVPDTSPDLTLIEGFNRAAQGRTSRRVVNSLQTSRGCRFQCKFCPTSKLFGGTHRTRSIESIVQDIRARRHLNPIFLVVDNRFAGDREHVKKLLHRLAQEDLGVHLIVFERHEIGRDTELLRLMWRAGVRAIIVGIESLEDSNLQSYNKQQSSVQVLQAVEQIQRHDLLVAARK